MILSAVFLAFLTLIVVVGLVMISKASLDEKEKRDSVLLISVLFLTVLTLNEIQNMNFVNSHDTMYGDFQSVFRQSAPEQVQIKKNIEVEYTEQHGQLLKQILGDGTTNYLVRASTRESKAFQAIRSKLESDGDDVAYFKADQSIWDLDAVREIFQKAIQYAKKDKPTTLLIEYSLGPKEKLGNLHSMISALYRLANVNIIVFGEFVEQLFQQDETLFWFARTVDI